MRQNPNAQINHRIHALQRRLKKPGAQPQVHKRLDTLRAKRYLRTQKRDVQLPFNATADTTIAGLRKNLFQTQAELTGQEANIRQNYGFEDKTNPYSIANRLQTEANQRRARDFNSYAAAGQLYSGSTQNALNADQSAANQGLDTQLRNYMAALGKVKSDRAAAVSQETEGEQSARAKALQDAVNTPIDPSGAPAPPGYVTRYQHRLGQRAKKLAKHGKKNRARKLQERIATNE